MDYGIIGGDGRLACLVDLLSKRGKVVATFCREGQNNAGLEALTEANNLVVNCPPKVTGGALAFEEVLALAREDARIFSCGPGHPEEEDGRVIDLWADEQLILDNARLTAEGAVAAAMRASDRALGDTHCLVVGWGRIGRALTELLVGLSAGVTVASRSEQGRHRAVERGAEAVDTASIGAALPGQGLVFNTAPAMVLGEDALIHADGDAMLIDLASPPYGIDLAAAWKLGLRAWREPALPGRYCPRSAAQALLNAMERHGL